MAEASEAVLEASDMDIEEDEAEKLRGGVDGLVLLPD